MTMTNKEMDLVEAGDRKQKRKVNAPCGYERWDDELQKNVTWYPAVLCEMDCSHCGFNPAVKEQRINRLLGIAEDSQTQEPENSEDPEEKGEEG